MKNGAPLCAFAAAALAAGTVSGRQDLALAGGGAPLADIVVASVEDKVLKFAADELKTHLDAITGGSFAVLTNPAPGRAAIRIAYAPDLERQQLRIKFGDNGVSLESGAFPEYAVWDFLRDFCGVSWLDPTEAGTVMPKNPDLAVHRTDRTDRPFAKSRDPGMMSGERTFMCAYSPELWQRGSAGWTNFLKTAYPSAFKRGHFGEVNRAISNRKNLFLRRMKAGGDWVHANHSFYWYYDRFWNSKHPRFERFRPELFAKGYGGEKGAAEGITRAYDSAKEPPQLCYSNPETVRQVVDDIRAYFDNGGFTAAGYRNLGRKGYVWGRNAYCIEPMDNNGFCKCPECTRQYRYDLKGAAAQHSDYWFTFVNAVAREIAKSHPGRKIATLAYHSRYGVPSFRLETNVVVHFCFSSNRVPSKRASIERQENQMRNWRAAYPGQPFGLWLYNTFPKEFSDRVTHVNCFPGFFAKTLQSEYRLFKELDISESIFNCGFVDDYENFLSLRWMWNPDEPLERLEQEYFSAYGAAARPLREFYRIVEERYADPECGPKNTNLAWYFPRIAWGYRGPHSVMKRLGELMAEAEKLADSPLAAARVANWKAGIWDYMRRGSVEADAIPCDRKGVSILRTMTRGGRPQPMAGDRLLGVPVDVAATNGNWLLPGRKADWKLTGRTEFTEGRCRGISLCGKGERMRYVIRKPFDDLKEIRVTITQHCALRSRAAFELYGLRDGRWVSLAPEVVHGAYSNWGAPQQPEDVSYLTYAFSFEPGCKIDGLAIEDRSPKHKWYWAGFAAFEAR